MEIIKARVCISSITENGTACANPVIDIHIGSDIVQNCEFEDGCITVQVPADDLKGKCISGVISCSDCPVCPPEPFEICFCDDNTDCSDCEVCVNGICQSKCPSQTCVDGNCQDCEVNDDCPNNKVCIGGECVCPPGSTGVDQWGNCIFCDDNTVLDPCYACVDGNIIPLDCDGFYCDPRDGECKECVDNSQCVGNTENKLCCVNGECECCPGYSFDFTIGRCVESPDCIDSDDCPECFQCVSGDCEPVVCPEGYVCQDGDCVWNPCPDQSCTNGLDCADGCGCNSATGMCEPCSEKSCINNECEQILGCECSNGTCIDADNPCSGPCSSSHDCGEGCTCYEGQCVSCDNFDCSNADCATQPGCQCAGSDCVGDDTCSDTLTITKDEVACTLSADLDIAELCQCTALVLQQKINTVTSNGDNWDLGYTYYARKGVAESSSQADTLPILDDQSNPLIADNDEPVSGSVQAAVTVNTVWTDEDNIPYTNTYVLTPVSYSFSSVAQITPSALSIPKVGTSYGVNPNEVVTSVKVVTSQDSDFEFENNCSYKATVEINNYTITTSIVAVTDVALSNATTITSADVRDPLFTWSKSNSGTFIENRYINNGSWDQSGVFRKVYVPISGTTYTDTLLGPDALPPTGFTLTGTEGELWSNMYYRLQIDCGCDKVRDAGKVVFCSPDSSAYTSDKIVFLNCGQSVRLDPTFDPCRVNSWRGEWDVTAPKEVQSYFTLRLNGTDVEHFVESGGQMVNYVPVSDSVGSVPMYNTYSLSGDVINTVEIVHSHDESCVISKTNSFLDKILNPTVTCNLTTAVYDIPYPVFDGDGNSFDITSVTSSPSVTWTDNTTSWSATLQNAQEYIITVTFDDGCTQELSVTPDCCEDLTLTIDETGSCAGQATLTANTGGVPVDTYTWSPGSESTQAIDVTSSGEYSVTVRAGECTKTTSYTVSITGEFTYTVETDPPGTSEICSGETVDLIFTPSISGGVLNYEIDTIAYTSGVISTTFDLSVGTASTYTFVSYVVDGCTYLLGDIKTFTLLTIPTIGMVESSPATYCTDSEIELTVTGNVGTVFTLNTGYSDTIPASGSIVFSEQFSLPGTYQIYIDTATLAGQACDVLITTSTITVVVVAGPLPVVNSASSVWTASGYDIVVDNGGTAATLTIDGGGATFGVPYSIAGATGGQEVIIVATGTGPICTVTDTYTIPPRGCGLAVGSVSATVYGIDVLASPASPPTFEIINGVPIVITAAGITGYTPSADLDYQLLRGTTTLETISSSGNTTEVFAAITPTASASYSIVVSDNNNPGCTISTPLTINVTAPQPFCTAAPVDVGVIEAVGAAFYEAYLGVAASTVINWRMSRLNLSQGARLVIDIDGVTVLDTTPVYTMNECAVLDGAAPGGVPSCLVGSDMVALGENTPTTGSIAVNLVAVGGVGPNATTCIDSYIAATSGGTCPGEEEAVYLADRGLAGQHTVTAPQANKLIVVRVLNACSDGNPDRIKLELNCDGTDYTAACP